MKILKQIRKGINLMENPIILKNVKQKNDLQKTKSKGRDLRELKINLIKLEAY
jgi:hypothetical protein